MTAPRTSGNGSALNLLFFLISLIFVGIFAAYEIAYVLIEKRRLVKWFPRKMASDLISYPERILTADLIGTNIASVSAAVFLTNWLLENLQGGLAVGIAGVVTTIAIVLLGEILPKNLARTHREFVVRYFSWLVYFLYWLSFIVTLPLESAIKKLVIKKSARGAEKTAKGEIERLILRGEEIDGIRENEAMMLQTALYLYETECERIMIPIKTVPALPADTDIDEFIRTAVSNPESWVLVYSGDIDHVEGYVTRRDLLHLKFHGGTIENIKKPAVFVYRDWPIKRVLREMRAAGVELSIVVDEYASVVGVLEQSRVVLELFDALARYGVEEIGREEEAEYVMRLSGDTLIEDLKELDIELPSDKFHTVGGLIISALHSVPHKGDKVRVGHYLLVVDEVDDAGVIKTVLLKKLKKKETDGKETV